MNQVTTSTAQKDLLRFLTCGSVDDGKSTLIGRLLYETDQIEKDVLQNLQRDSKIFGTTGTNFDPALLTDGLKAEREQGITIDVAYRYFQTPMRKFIIADTPGHVQYTKNMVTGASKANLAIILIDARNGITEQTKRHSFIVSLLGIQHIVVAINKIDVVNYSQEVFDAICTEYKNFSSKLSIKDIHFIPISALNGDNIVTKSDHTPWYQGTTLLNHLEQVHIASDSNQIDFRFPVQYVNRPNKDYRGYCGTIASGTVRLGDKVQILPSKQTSTIKAIDMFHQTCTEAHAGQAISIRLEDELDISRGDVIAPINNVPSCSTNLNAMIVWMDTTPLQPEKEYIIHCGTKEALGKIETLHYAINVNTMRRKSTPLLHCNEIGRVHIVTKEPIVFDAYSRNQNTGSGIIIDIESNNTVGAFMVIDRNSIDTTIKDTAIHVVSNGTNLFTTSKDKQSLQEAMQTIKELLQQNGFE